MRETDALVDLYVDGEVISTTGEHPFWTPDQGWVEAKDLHVGSLLQTEDGRIIDVDGVEKREGQFKVYNFKVEGFHTYYVSDLGVLVHNKARKINDPRLPKQQGYWEEEPGDSGWYSNNPQINTVTGGEPVPFKNNYPNFSKWAQAEVEIPVAGKETKDFRAADKVFAEKMGWTKKSSGRPNGAATERYRIDNNLTWHHVPGSNKMQLLPQSLHNNIPHTGGAAQARNNP